MGFTGRFKHCLQVLKTSALFLEAENGRTKVTWKNCSHTCFSVGIGSDLGMVSPKVKYQNEYYQTSPDFTRKNEQ